MIHHFGWNNMANRRFSPQLSVSALLLTKPSMTSLSDSMSVYLLVRVHVRGRIRVFNKYIFHIFACPGPCPSPCPYISLSDSISACLSESMSVYLLIRFSIISSFSNTHFLISFTKCYTLVIFTRFVNKFCLVRIFACPSPCPGPCPSPCPYICLSDSMSGVVSDCIISVYSIYLLVRVHVQVLVRLHVRIFACPSPCPGSNQSV